LEVAGARSSAPDLMHNPKKQVKTKWAPPRSRTFYGCTQLTATPLPLALRVKNEEAETSELKLTTDN
jgi:hypothetical protein